MSALLAVPLVLLLLSLLWRRSTQSKKCDAPGPLSLPLIGSCLRVWQPLWRWVQVCGRESYGDVIRVVFPDHESIIVSSYEELREVFLNENLLGRPKTSLRSADRNRGLALSEGKLWRTHRTFSVRALSDYGCCRPSAQADASEQAQILVKRIRDQLPAGRCGEVEAERLLQDCVGSVIAKMIFGNDGLPNDERFCRKFPLVQQHGVGGPRSIARMLLKRMLRFCPPLRHLLPQRQPNESVLEVLQQFQKYINQRRGQLQQPSDSVQRDCADYIEFYLKQRNNFFSDEEVDEEEEQDARAEDELLPDGRLAMTIFDLMTGGIDAVASFVSWALLLAAANPAAQEKLRSEAGPVFPKISNVNFDEKQRLPYCEAFLEEVQRFVTLLPLGATRRAVADTKIGGYRIPKGTRIVPNLYGLHHDPKLFPEPHLFQPDRFINADGQFQSSRHMLAFSLGKRACPGESLARREAFLFVVSVLLSYSVSLPKAEQERLPELMEGVGGFVRRPGSHKLVFELLSQDPDSDAD